jgi:hypothetical protein
MSHQVIVNSRQAAKPHARVLQAERLRAGLERAQGTLDKAQHLLGQLSGEKGRWQSQARALRTSIATLPLQMLLASAFTNYLVSVVEGALGTILAGMAVLSDDDRFLLWYLRGYRQYHRPLSS